jgi:hypothetical protein
MGQVKMAKNRKAWLIEAVKVCMARIDLLESNEDGNEVGNDSKVRSELRELKAAVFLNAASVQVITQDRQDFMDRPDTDWDAIHKLAAEQKATPEATPTDAPPVAANVPANAPHAPPVRENGTAGTGESNKTKLAKRV